MPRSEVSVITEDEGRARARRSLMLLAALVALGGGFAATTGIRDDLDPQALMASAIAIGFVLLGVSMSASGQIALGSSAGLVALVAYASPLFAADRAADDGGIGGLACLLSVIAVGVASLFAARWTLGAIRRRSGGATAIQGAAAAMAASFGVGLHCPSSAALHLATHALGAFIVGVLLRRAILR